MENHPLLKSTIDPEELTTIIGGGAVGVLGNTFGGATAGVKICAAGGPWAMAACGVAGAVVGTGFGVWTGA